MMFWVGETAWVCGRFRIPEISARGFGRETTTASIECNHLDLLDGLFELFHIPGDDRDVSSFLCESFRQGQSQSRRSAGNVTML